MRKELLGRFCSPLPSSRRDTYGGAARGIADVPFTFPNGEVAISVSGNVSRVERNGTTSQ